MSEYRSYVEGPRWARFDIALRKYSVDHGLAIDIDRQTTWLQEIVYFTVYGSDAQISRFQAAMNQAIREWNEPAKTN